MDMRRKVSGVMDAIARLVLCAVMLGWFATVQAQQSVLEVIELKYLSAEQVVPMLKPFLAPGGTVSALQNRVIVRTTPQNLAELRKVLDVVDTMPKRPVISVRQEAVGTGLDSEAEVSGSIGTDSSRTDSAGPSPQARRHGAGGQWRQRCAGAGIEFAVRRHRSWRADRAGAGRQ